MNKIEQILIKVKTYQWPYPKTFLTLKNARVKSYAVSLLGAYEAIYEGGFGIWKERVHFSYQGFDVEGEFYPDEVRAAVRKHAEKKTSFLEFLEDSAASGVACYKVDMQHSTVTYFNLNKTKSYVEVVPSWEVVE